jgi:hypothetical protein
VSGPNAKAVAKLEGSGYSVTKGREFGNFRSEMVNSGEAGRPPVGELVTNVNDGTARLNKGRMTSAQEWKKLAGVFGANAYSDIRFSA